MSAHMPWDVEAEESDLIGQGEANDYANVLKETNKSIKKMFINAWQMDEHTHT